jgi:DUF1680 family protein
MNRRKFLTTAAAAPLIATTPLLLPSFGAPESPNLTERTTAGAPFRERYKLTLRRALTGSSPAFAEEFLLADVRPTAERRFTEYSGDTSGRYVGALSTAARVYHTSFAGLDALVEKIVELQKPDGYFGENFHYDRPTDLDLDLLWGNGRLLVGLLEYYRYKPSAAVLAACRRLGDFLVRISPLMQSKQIRDEFGAAHFASSYICWMQQTEGLANLYIVTRDPRYKALVVEIGYLTALRGVMDLYRDTSQPALLRQCEDAWRDIVDSQDLLVTGGVPEGWSPNKHRTEGCAEADWVRFNLALWKVTANPKYLSMAERATFNELAFNQFASGDFGHRVLTETGFQGDDAVRAWWCCTLHGLRCFPDIHTSAFGTRDDGLSYNLPIDGHIETSNLSAEATSWLAHNGSIRIKITSSTGASASLRICKPERAASVMCKLNNSEILNPVEGGVIKMHRQWQAGDVVTLNYAMFFRSEPSGPDRVAFSVGPWLLGASASDNPTYFGDLTTENQLCTKTQHGLAAVTHPPRNFAVPVAATSIRYVPAEFPNHQETLALRAIAEQTGQLPTAWELRFLTTPDHNPAKT